MTKETNKKTKSYLLLATVLFCISLLSVPLISQAQLVVPETRTISEIQSELDYWYNSAEKERETIKKLQLEQGELAKNWHSDDSLTKSEKIEKKYLLEEEISNKNKEIRNLEKTLADLQAELKQAGADDETIKENADKSKWAAKTSKEQEEGLVCWNGKLTINWGVCSMQVISWVGTWIIYIFGSILFVAGSIFDLSIFISITKIGEWYFENEGVIMVWKLARDMANMLFLFVLLYIAIGTIFDLSGVNDPKKLVTNVIIIALLVNFSGFFVRVIVDASNVVAYEFYTAMSGDGGWSGVGNIGSNLVSKLAPEKYLISENESIDANGIKKTRITTTGPSILGIIVEVIMSIFIIIVTSFVLLVASILFIIRTVVLLFLYMVSPLAFVSKIIPGKNYFESWLSKLITQSLYAPAFLIPFYFVFVLLKSGIFTGGSTEMESALSFLASGTVATTMSGFVILGLMISCIFIAQKVGAVGLGAATSLAGGATAMAGRPLSRYGGRLASSAGSKIAKTGAGKTISESWDTGRLSRVRQSWNTGILKDVRDTQTAQKVGQAMRNPLNTAGAGIGMAAGTAGVRGMDNIFGAKTFNKAVEEKGNKIIEDVNKIERDEDKVKFLEGLAGSGSKEEFDYVYKKLSPEDRRKLELSARKTANDTSLDKSIRNRANRISERLTENRKGLKGKAAQDTAIEMIKKEKGSAKIDIVKDLQEEDFYEVYKGLSKEERVEFEIQAKATLGTAHGLWPMIDRAKKKLKPGEQAAVSQGAKAEEAFERVKSLIATPGATITPADVSNISREKIIEIDPVHLKRSDVAPYLTTEHLKALKNSGIPDTDLDPIRTELERQITAAGATLPPNLKRINDYFHGAGAGF
jgi:hypothetical protein